MNINLIVSKSYCDKVAMIQSSISVSLPTFALACLLQAFLVGFLYTGQKCCLPAFHLITIMHCCLASLRGIAEFPCDTSFSLTL